MKLPKWGIPFLLPLLFQHAEVLANSWYASPTGLSTNNGTLNSPWSLSHALTRPGTIVLPGDTIWFRGGVYKGHFTSSISGTLAAPVVVRNYPNESPVFMGNAISIIDDVVLTINGAFSQFMGLEITTNAILRISTGTVDPPLDMYTSTGVYIYGQSVKLINCNIHDCPRGGIGYWSTSLNAEVYGCLIYNNGYTNASRGHGPGLYIQNIDENKPKSLVNSFIFNGFSIGVQFYSSSGDNIKGFIMDSCTVFNSGSNTSINQIRRMNFLAAGANASNNARVRNLVVTNNVFYRDTTDNSSVLNMPYSSQRKNVELGTEDETLWDVNVNFNNNHLYGDPTPLLIHKWDSGIFRNNFIYSYKNSYILNRQLIEQVNDSAPFTNWNYNTYYTNQPTFTTPFSNKTFAEWKSKYNIDSNSVFNNTAPLENYYFVRKNKYETQKYYVTVQNYLNQNTLLLPFTSPSLLNASYAVFDVQNSFRIPVDTGTFNGITIPLNMQLTNVAPLTGISPVTPKHTSKTLGTFIIEFYPEYSTVKNGNWNDPTVWSSSKIPQYYNKVNINHNIVIAGNAWCKSAVVTSGQVNVKPDVIVNVGQQ